MIEMERYMSVYPPTLFYENTRQALNTNIIHISSGSCLLPVPSSFTYFIDNHYIEKLSVLLSDYGESAGSILIRQNMANLENFRTNTNYYDESNVFITLGTTEAIDVSLLLLSRSYRRVFCFVPLYYSVGSCAQLYHLELNSLCALGKNGWEVDINQLDKLDAHSILYLNSPNAISGYHISGQTLKQIFSLVKEKGCVCIFDQIIRDLTWETDFTHPLTVAAEADILDQIFFFYGPSKDKSIPGARIGYLYCPQPFVKQVATMLNLRYWAPPLMVSDLTHLDSIFNCLQAGFLGYIGFEKDRDIDIISLYESYCRDLYSNINIIKTNMIKIGAKLAPYLSYSNQPSSGYSLFFKLSDIDGIDQAEFTKQLELKHGLRTTLGPMFGLTQKQWEENYGLWLRLNATLPDANLEEGLNKLLAVLERYL